MVDTSGLLRVAVAWAASADDGRIAPGTALERDPVQDFDLSTVDWAYIEKNATNHVRTVYLRPEAFPPEEAATVIVELTRGLLLGQAWPAGKP